MVQDGGKKKKNKNRNKKKQNEGEQAPQQHQEPRVAPFAVPEIASISTPPPPASVPAFEKKPVNGMTNGFVKNTNINNHEVVLKGLAAEASHWMNYNWSAIQDAEAKYQTYLAANKKAARKTEKKEEDFDLFASDEEPAAKPAKTGKKAAKKQENAQGSSPSSLAAEIAKARQHIKNSLECVDGIAAMAGGASADVVKKLQDLELENKDLKKVTNDLKAMVLKLETRVSALEKGGPAPAAGKPAPAKAAPAKEESDDDVDLFGSDDESEDDEEKNRVREERLAAYHAKKAKKPALIAKTSVVLDVKPWDDETDMDAMLKEVKTITKEGLLWGASKLVPVGYGINKLRIIAVVEDEKVSIDELQDQIAEFEDYVQSVDVDSMQKI